MLRQMVLKDILIIEDSKATSILITEFLKRLGYDKVHMAQTGEEGMKIFKNLAGSGTAPIVLLDYNLPDTNANEVMFQIFNIKPDVKIILETAEAREESTVKEALRRGAYMYLQKPIRFENIKDIIKTIEEEEENVDGHSEIEPKIDTLVSSSTRISLIRLAEYTQSPQEEILAHLKDLVKEGKIIQIGKIKEISCNSCGSVKITQNFTCPSCKSFNFNQGKLVEHFTCGNVSLEESYKDYICPKCHKQIKIIGVDHKIIENYYICNDCPNKFPEPNVDYLCVRCNNSFTVDHAKWVTSEGFKPKNPI